MGLAPQLQLSCKIKRRERQGETHAKNLILGSIFCAFLISCFLEVLPRPKGARQTLDIITNRAFAWVSVMRYACLFTFLSFRCPFKACADYEHCSQAQLCRKSLLRSSSHWRSRSIIIRRQYRFVKNIVLQLLLTRNCLPDRRFASSNIHSLLL